MRRKKPVTSGLKIANDLSGFEQIVEEAKANQPEEEKEEEEVEYSLNPEINIPQEQFESALQELIHKVQEEGKMNMASAIREGKNTLHHNQWTLEVANDVLLKIVKREKALMPYMREKLSVMELFMDLKVDATLVSSKSDKPYTEEQKLKVMTDENEALKRLQEIFKTRIIY